MHDSYSRAHSLLLLVFQLERWTFSLAAWPARVLEQPQWDVSLRDPSQSFWVFRFPIWGPSLVTTTALIRSMQSSKPTPVRRFWGSQLVQNGESREIIRCFHAAGWRLLTILILLFRVPDEMAFPKLTTQQAPGFIGGWCLVGIVAASLSTASGAILAMGTVFSHNIVRQLDFKWPHLITDDVS